MELIYQCGSGFDAEFLCGDLGECAVDICRHALAVSADVEIRTLLQPLDHFRRVLADAILNVDLPVAVAGERSVDLRQRTRGQERLPGLGVDVVRALVLVAEEQPGVSATILLRTLQEERAEGRDADTRADHDDRCGGIGGESERAVRQRIHADLAGRAHQVSEVAAAHTGGNGRFRGVALRGDGEVHVVRVGRGGRGNGVRAVTDRVHQRPEFVGGEGSAQFAQRICKEIGLGRVPTVNVDNACSSGATAVHEAWQAISQGLIDVAVVIGVEKLTQFGGGTLPLSAEDREVKQGIVMPAVYAMRATRYLYETDATPEDLALVSVKARKHGALNPFAQFRKETTVEEVLAARPIADPLTLPMCCPTGDGAAVVILASDRARARLDSTPGVRIAASILHSGHVAEGYRDMTKPEISYDSARDAYAMAGIEPKDLDMIELHDAFAIAELVYYEAFGLAAPGHAVDLIRDGKTPSAAMSS